MTCNHDEGPHHDCNYVEWRNSLIEIAEAIADREAADDSRRWNAVFHRAMDRLISEPLSVIPGGLA